MLSVYPKGEKEGFVLSQELNGHSSLRRLGDWDFYSVRKKKVCLCTWIRLKLSPYILLSFYKNLNNNLITLLCRRSVDTVKVRCHILFYIHTRTHTYTHNCFPLYVLLPPSVRVSPVLQSNSVLHWLTFRSFLLRKGSSQGKQRLFDGTLGSPFVPLWNGGSRTFGQGPTNSRSGTLREYNLKSSSNVTWTLVVDSCNLLSSFVMGSYSWIFSQT